jgi:hypothetical protein
MSRAKKKPRAVNALGGFRYWQPYLGFSSKVMTRPLSGKADATLHSMNYAAECREELVWDIRQYFQNKAVDWKTENHSWQKSATISREIDLDDRRLKQPGVTYLYLGAQEDTWEETGNPMCKRPCCASRFPHLVDAITGTVGVLLSEDRYVGDWWQTEPELVCKPDGRGAEYRWYGSDNFFLRHPALVSMFLGSFRQSVLLFTQSFDEAISKAVKRQDVEDCLTNSDPDLAMRIMTKLRPWIEVKQRVTSYPFAHGYWDRLRKLHRAISNYGYDELFGGDIAHSWKIARGTDDDDRRRGVANGAIQYFGTNNKNLTDAGKRLNRLGR